MRTAGSAWLSSWSALAAVFLCALLGAGVCGVSFATADPSRDVKAMPFKDLEFSDSTRNREIPVRAYYPKAPSVRSGQSGPAKLPTVIFSPALGAPAKNYAYFGQGLAALGFLVLELDHPLDWGNVDAPSAPSSTPKRVQSVIDKMRQLKKSADDPSVWTARALDVSSLIDHLGEVVPEADASRIALAGDSLGATTTLIEAGETFRVGTKVWSLPESRVQAFIAISPMGPQKGPKIVVKDDAWTAISRPVLIVTGSKDTGRGGEPPSWRQTVYDEMPADGSKYLFWIDGATPLSFTDESYGGMASVHELTVHAAFVFLKAQLLGDAAAKLALLTDLAIQHK